MDGWFFNRQLTHKFAKLGPDAANGSGRRIQPLLRLFIRKGKNALFHPGTWSDLKSLPRSGKRIAFAMHELLDPQSELNLAATIEPLPGAAFIGFESWKLGLPETEDVWFHGTDASHVPNAKIQPVWNFSSGREVLLGGLCGHPILRNGVSLNV
jgi:hypothetical protein